VAVITSGAVKGSRLTYLCVTRFLGRYRLARCPVDTFTLRWATGFAMNDDPRTGLARLIEEIEASAYRRGADDMREHFITAVREAIRLLNGLLEASAPPNINPTNPPKDVSGKRSLVEPRAGSAQLKVLTIVRTFSGLPSSEITGRMEGELEAAAVRTALSRLKDRGAVVQKKRAWFAVEAHSQKQPPT
jgi:hypothetical protein